MNHNRLLVFKRFGGGLAVTLGGLGVATSCSSSHSSADCLSPATISRPFSGDTRPGVTNDQKTWRLGILATTKLPTDSRYIGLVVGFKNPNDATATWQESNPVPPPLDSVELLKLGPGAVEFQTQIEAKAGTADCKSAPATVFSDPKPQGSLPPGAGQPTGWH